MNQTRARIRAWAVEKSMSEADREALARVTALAEGKAKLVLIRWFDQQAKAHDHELSCQQQVLRRVTRRLKS